jgi:hypothetical protein
MNIMDTMAGRDLQGLRAAARGQVRHHRQLRALPDAPPVVLTSSASQRRFGSQLGHYPFAARADLCARAIENAPAPPLSPA